MRLLALLQGKKPEDQIGYHEGFKRLTTEGILDSYHAMAHGLQANPEDWIQFYRQAIQIVQNEGVDTVLLQFFHGANIASPDAFVNHLRKKNPAIIVIATCGDPFGRFFNRLPRSMLDAARLADLTFFTGMGYMAKTVVNAGAKNVMLMPNGSCQVRFAPPSISDPVEKAEFDLIFIGSNHRGRNPFTHLSISAKLRRRMVDRLGHRYGRKFALFGHNWGSHPSWQGPISYNDQLSAIQRSRLVIGGFPAVMVPYYTSDRFFNSLASGVPLLDFRVPRVDRLLVAGQDWYPYDDIDTLINLVDRQLDADHASLNKSAQACRETILAQHTQYHRSKDMLEIADRLRQHRKQGSRLAPQLPNCFHDKVDTSKELPFATFNWQG